MIFDNGLSLADRASHINILVQNNKMSVTQGVKTSLMEVFLASETYEEYQRVFESCKYLLSSKMALSIIKSRENALMNLRIRLKIEISGESERLKNAKIFLEHWGKPLRDTWEKMTYDEAYLELERFERPSSEMIINAILKADKSALSTYFYRFFGIFEPVLRKISPSVSEKLFHTQRYAVIRKYGKQRMEGEDLSYLEQLKMDFIYEADLENAQEVGRYQSMLLHR